MPSLLSSTDDILASRPARVMFDALREGRLSHSLIISGEEIGSVEKIAYRLAAEILKIPDAPEDVAHHPDLFTIRPTGKMRQISVDDTRDLIRKVHHSSYRGGAKVAIFHEADRMHQSSVNIFLKTLEEPPAGTTLLLLTTRPHFLLATVRSRCLHFRLPTGRSDDLLSESIVSWLDDYSAWLEKMRPGIKQRSEISAQVIGLYGLSSRFAPLLKSAVDQEWETRKEKLPESLTEEEEEAYFAEIRINVRDQIFTELGRRLRTFAESQLHDPKAIRAFIRTAADLDKMAGLLHVNLQDGAALEGYLLAALRHWGRR
ncbi:MAG TPA: DNA polymerase III subunit gamma/tau [Opitutales bacterium]|nr:DNA polymerase III subunit gamma/tau [Opitutales bacterium]